MRVSKPARTSQRERYAMDSSTNVIRLRQPHDLDDPLTEVLWAGARRLLAQAVEIEAEAFLAAMTDLRLPDGRARLVRHGHGPEREIATGIGRCRWQLPNVASFNRVDRPSCYLAHGQAETASESLLPATCLKPRPNTAEPSGNSPLAPPPPPSSTRQAPPPPPRLPVLLPTIPPSFLPPPLSSPFFVDMCLVCSGPQGY
jgi:hypothetical protein